MYIFIFYVYRLKGLPMNYFIEILYVLSTVVSISLESRQEKSKNSFIRSQQTSIYKYPYLKSEDEDISEPLRHDGALSIRDDLEYDTRVQSNKENPSKRFPILKQYMLQSENELSREKEDILERDSIIVTTRTARIMQRKPRGYKAIRITNEKRTKSKGTDMDDINKDRVNHNHKQQIKTRHSITQTRNKKYEEGPIGLYINTSYQVLYNDTHYSPYFYQLLGNYDINYLWSKQKFAKEFDKSFKLPPTSLNRQMLKSSLRQVTRNRNKNKLPTKINHAPLECVVCVPTTQMDLFYKDKKEKEGKTVNRFVDFNKMPRQNNILSKLGYELDSNLRQVISNVMSYMGYKNLEEKTINKNKDKELDRDSYVRKKEKKEDKKGEKEDKKCEKKEDKKKKEKKEVNLIDLMNEFKNKTRDEIKNAIEVGIVDNINKVIIAKEETHQYLNETKEKYKKKIDGILDHHKIITKKKPAPVTQKKPVVVTPCNTSENASVRNNNSDLWHPWIHRVEDDIKVNSFIKEISNNNLRLFTAVGRKTKNSRWKKILENVAEMYREKFNDYIIETRQHHIKSKMGTERVILNSVDVSNSIVKRLVNFITGEVDRKGLLRNNSEVLNQIDKELKKETKTELKRACSKLNVCRRLNGMRMSTFLADMATKIVALDQPKFKEAFNNLVQAIKAENFANVLDTHTDKGIQETARHFEHLPTIFQMAAMSAIRNILTSVNKPFVMYNDINVSQLDKTMALFEILKILDEKVPNSDENINAWNNITSQDITNPDTMTEFVTHVKKVLSELDDETRKDILKQCKVIYP